MPHFELSCNKGHEWDVFTTIAHNPDDLKRCPTCGEDALSPVVTAAKMIERERTAYEKMPKEERAARDHAMLIKNKRWIESLPAEDILSGKIPLVEKGPSEYRPRMPEHLRKIISYGR